MRFDGNNHSCDSNAECCYRNLLDDMVEDNPLDLENIKEKQDKDNGLHQTLTNHPTWYSRKNINDVIGILCYTKPGDNAVNWKGSTICTLPEIVYNTSAILFFHVFVCPQYLLVLF